MKSILNMLLGPPLKDFLNKELANSDFSVELAGFQTTNHQGNIYALDKMGGLWEVTSTTLKRLNEGCMIYPKAGTTKVVPAKKMKIQYKLPDDAQAVFDRLSELKWMSDLI